jgi:hypothetical protein
MFRLVGDFEKVITKSGKSFKEISQIVSSSHPEILFTLQDWEQINEETQNMIIGRIKKTLKSIA